MIKYLDMNRIDVDGEIVNIGRPQDIVGFCGFKGAADVQRAAAKFSHGTQYMKMDDVVEWFKSH